MPKKVTDFAKELNMIPVDAVEKLKSLGYDVKSAADTLTDMDATAAKNTIENSRKKKESTIVKAESKKENLPLRLRCRLRLLIRLLSKLRQERPVRLRLRKLSLRQDLLSPAV